MFPILLVTESMDYLLNQLPVQHVVVLLVVHRALEKVVESETQFCQAGSEIVLKKSASSFKFKLMEYARDIYWSGDILTQVSQYGYTKKNGKGRRTWEHGNWFKSWKDNFPNSITKIYRMVMGFINAFVIPNLHGKYQFTPYEENDWWQFANRKIER